MTKKNQQLAKEGGNSGADPFTKKKEPVKKDRTYFEKHTIGILTIPKINVNLPIFDQTTMKLLEPIGYEVPSSRQAPFSNSFIVV